MSGRGPADDRSDMELLEAIKAVLYVLMSATEKLTAVALVLINRRRRQLREPFEPDPPI